MSRLSPPKAPVLQLPRRPLGPGLLHLRSMTEPATLVSQVPCNKAQLENGSFRQHIAQLGRLGYRRMQLQLTGSCVDGPPTPELIRALGVIYDTLSEVEPRTYTVPLVQCAGWDTAAVEQQGAASSTVVAVIAGQEGLRQHPGDGTHLVVLPPADDPSPGNEQILLPQVIPAPQAATSAQQVQEVQAASSEGPQLQFDHVAVGGTFDRLHCGHELLLAATALVARKTVYVGITADKLLLNKNHRELLQPYDQRRDAAVQFLRAVRPSLHVEAGPLNDPHEPTQAELDPSMQALVVSQETLPGAVKINQGRLARGFAPLLVLVVPVIGGKDPAHKLSSTQLRAQDAAQAPALQLHK